MHVQSPIGWAPQCLLYYLVMYMSVVFFADIAEYGGAETDHESGDGSDQLEERGNQVQEKRAFPGRP